MGDGKEETFRKLIRPQKGGVTKPFETQTTYNNDRVDTTKTPSPSKNFNIISNFLSPLLLQHIQLLSRFQGRVGHALERATEIMSSEGEVGHIPEGGGRKV